MTTAKDNRGQPNIVFITADQLGAAFVHCYGSGVPSTPTLDEWARRGVRFDRAYAACPVCAPNRAIWLTGRSPAVNGMIHNNYTHCGDTPTYAHVLGAHGYRTGGFGKFHQLPMPLGVPDDLAFLGFDESVVTEDPKWGPWLKWVGDKSPEHYEIAVAMAWGSGQRMGATPEQSALWRSARPIHLDPLKAASPWSKMYPSPLPAELHDSTFITDVSIDFIERHRRDHRDQPFFCHISYVDPHDPYDPPQPYAGMFDPDDMPDAIAAEWLEQGPRLLDATRDDISFRGICDNPAAIRQLRALYHGSLRFLDDQLARIGAALDRMGLWDNTVVIFNTDHGEMMGDHGLISKGIKHYDTGIRCPLIMLGGGIGAGVADQLVSSLDMFPTLCDLARVPAEDLPPLEGRSFAGADRCEAVADAWPELAVCMHEAQSVITDDGWRLTRYTDHDEGQMFDLRNDPQEQHNRYHDPAVAAKRQELLERLVRVVTRPSRVPHYRNMHVIDGRRCALGGNGSSQLLPGTPDYELRIVADLA